MTKCTTEKRWSNSLIRKFGIWSWTKFFKCYYYCIFDHTFLPKIFFCKSLQNKGCLTGVALSRKQFFHLTVIKNPKFFHFMNYLCNLSWGFDFWELEIQYFSTSAKNIFEIKIDTYFRPAPTSHLPQFFVMSRFNIS